MSKQRIQYVDIARGLAMICIVLGHLGEAQINRVVFTFHVPIFFLISGYFFREGADLKSLLKRQTQTLIAPYWLTCLAIIGLSMVFCEIFTPEISSKKTAMDWVFASLYGAGNSYKEPFYIKQIGAIWFLLATFWAVLSMKLVLSLRKNMQPLAVLFFFGLGWLSAKWFWFPASIQAGWCALLYVYIGYLCRKVKVEEVFPREIRIFGTVCAFVVWFCFIRDFQSFYLVRCDVGRGAVDIFGSLCACYCVIKISQFIEKHARRLSNALAYMGRYSIIILCAHIVELDLFPWWRLVNLFTSWGMPESWALYVKIAGKFAWILPVMLICSKWNFTRRLFGFAPNPAKKAVPSA